MPPVKWFTSGQHAVVKPFTLRCLGFLRRFMPRGASLHSFVHSCVRAQVRTIEISLPSSTSVPIDVVIYLAHLLMSTANVLLSFAPHEFIDRHYFDHFFRSRSSTSEVLFALRSRCSSPRCSSHEISKRIYNYISENISRHYIIMSRLI